MAGGGSCRSIPAIADCAQKPIRNTSARTRMKWALPSAVFACAFTFVFETAFCGRKRQSLNGAEDRRLENLFSPHRGRQDRPHPTILKMSLVHRSAEAPHFLKNPCPTGISAPSVAECYASEEGI